MAKKQQMRWTPKGAHLLLQIRTKVLNNEFEEVFRTWYPKFQAAALGPDFLTVSPWIRNIVFD